jgi:carboxyl-terminal processing protease
LIAAALILLVVGVASARADATPYVPGFDVPLASKVFATALAFAAPRVLDPATPQSLTLWGLQGITALDPALSADLIGAKLQLSMGGRVLFARAAPPSVDAPAWGRMAADVWNVACANSANLRAVGTRGVIAAFFDEMFNHLDPYSRYEPPEPAEAERTKLSVDADAGLGLVQDGHAVVVDDLVPDGPGQQAGVRVGDTILSIDGRHIHGRVDLARALLSGPEGTAMTLRLRGRDGVVRDIPISLAYVPPETVFPERIGAMLVIHITSFVNNTAERLSEAIEAGLAAKPAPAAVVIDLRGNRGGLLRQAVTAVALLADHGIIASTAGRDPEATHDWRIDGGDLTHGLPVIVLVDGSTASAAEIMAAALADLGRGVVVGSATLGKGLVQTITRLPDGGELFVTWSRVLAPRGWPLQSLGVLPQICTSLGDKANHQALMDLADNREDMAKALERSRAARAPLAVTTALDIRAACPAAEGSDADMQAADFVTTHPKAYQTALLPALP